MEELRFSPRPSESESGALCFKGLPLLWAEEARAERLGAYRLWGRPGWSPWSAVWGPAIGTC